MRGAAWRWAAIGLSAAAHLGVLALLAWHGDAAGLPSGRTLAVSLVAGELDTMSAAPPSAPSVARMAEAEEVAALPPVDETEAEPPPDAVEAVEAVPVEMIPPPPRKPAPPQRVEQPMAEPASEPLPRLEPPSEEPARAAAAEAPAAPAAQPSAPAAVAAPSEARGRPASGEAATRRSGSEADYAALLWGHIQGYLRQVEVFDRDRRRGLSGDRRVRIVLEADGQVAAVEVTASSGSASIDRAIERSIRRASPVPPPPAGVPSVLLPVRLDLR